MCAIDSSFQDADSTSIKEETKVGNGLGSILVGLKRVELSVGSQLPFQIRIFVPSPTFHLTPFMITFLPSRRLVHAHDG